MSFRAAEVHYFRVDPDLWELVLLRAHQFEADTISTYIPWGFHEPEEGLFDLAGRTDDRRDLIRFVKLIDRFGMRLIAKPGPFVDAELLGGGVPTWLPERYPETIARRWNGDPFPHSDSHVPRCSVRHPLYVERVGRWYDAVAPILLGAQTEGFLEAVQVDNECPGDGFWSYEMDPPSPNRADYNDPWRDRDVQMPGGWPSPPPSTPEELAPFVELDRYADEQMVGAVATFAQMLRDRGIAAPLFHDMCCGRWEIGPMVADMGMLAQATGWLGSNVYAEDLRAPFFLHGEYGYSFEEYVHYCWWRPALTRTLAPDRPVLIPEISAVADLYLHAPLIGGTDAFCVYVLHQVPDDASDVGSYPRWASEAPLRADGTVEARFWNGKTLFTWQAAGGERLATSQPGADVALVYRRDPEHAATWAEVDGAGWPEGDPFGEEVRAMNTGRRSQEQAQALVRAGIEFDVVDPRFAPQGWQERYRHVLEPGDAVPLDPGLRYAWTDVEGVDASVRRATDGSRDVFVVLVNRTQERATGVVRWRGQDAGLAFALDGSALSAAHVDDQGRVVSAILGGRARLGAMSFDGRLGVVGRFGDTLALSAPTDGEFSVPRGDRPVSRLGLDGTSTPWPHADGDVVVYRAALGESVTDLLWVGEPVAAYLEAIDVFAEAMAERVGDQTDWQRIQRDFAAARVRGDRDEELALRRRLVRLAGLELTVPDRERARGQGSS
jgi:hypothetical protein